MITKDPDPETMAWSLSRLAEQDYPVSEAIVVDSSPTPPKVSIEGINERVIHAPEAGNGEAREIGLSEARGDYILEMDEDAVLVRDDYLSQAVDELTDDRVAATGGVALPLRDNLSGHAVAMLDRVNPTALGTHYMVYPRTSALPGVEEEFYGRGNRGEDISARGRLKEMGEVRRMPNQAVLKDLPTTRQSGAGSGIIGGIIAGFVTAAVQERVTEWAQLVLEDANFTRYP